MKTIYPYSSVKCVACDFEGRPLRTGAYRASLAATSLLFGLSLAAVYSTWNDPTANQGLRSLVHSLLGLTALCLCAMAYLLTNANGYRCRNCNGILF